MQLMIQKHGVEALNLGEECQKKPLPWYVVVSAWAVCHTLQQPPPKPCGRVLQPPLHVIAGTIRLLVCSPVDGLLNLTAWPLWGCCCVTGVLVAARDGDLAKVHQYLRSMPDAESETSPVRIACKEGVTALMIAARYGQVAVAEKLIAAGADIEGKDVDDETPLTNAAQLCQPETVKLLLAHGAKVYWTDNTGGCFRGKQMPQLRLLWYMLCHVHYLQLFGSW